MTLVTPDQILLAFLVFCRIGACIMLLPGIGGGRIPQNARLLLALALAIALTPLFTDDLRQTLTAAAANPFAVIMTETAMGLLIGFLIRLFFLALDFAALAVGNFIGYGSVFSMSIEGHDAASPIGAIMTLPAMALFFILDQHLKVIYLLQNSYASVPLGTLVDAEASLKTLLMTLDSAFRIALQICAPLLVYSLAINVLFGVLNKMVPQVPAYFISAPFVIFGGLALLYLLIVPMLSEFSEVLEISIRALGLNG
ncbi:MAG: flagellar biosynthetic protein FliR [Hyphomicrobium sp.]|nr:flagellar biosynthetic protein FliR [Hyphomicrobium sp.]